MERDLEFAKKIAALIEEEMTERDRTYCIHGQDLIESILDRFEEIESVDYDGDPRYYQLQYELR